MCYWHLRRLYRLWLLHPGNVTCGTAAATAATGTAGADVTGCAAEAAGTAAATARGHIDI